MEILDQPVGGGLMLPSPLGNVLPALAISLLALGILERDGIWLFDGIGVDMATASLVCGVIFAMIQIGIYFLAHAWP